MGANITPITRSGVGGGLETSSDGTTPVSITPDVTTVQTIATASNIGVLDGAWKDMATFTMTDYNRGLLWATFTVNDSTGNEIQIILRPSATSSEEFILPQLEVYQYTLGDADTKIAIPFSTDGCVPLILVRSRAADVDTGGGTIGTLTLAVSRAWV